MTPYFEEPNKLREVAYWAAATQQQIERWEPLVAEAVSIGWKQEPRSAPLYWGASIERHFLLIAASQLVTAMKFAQFPIHVTVELAEEISGGRDMVEHWQNNMPVFNVHQRSVEPRFKSGKRFADLNPTFGPYNADSWDNTVGPKVLPNVPVQQLHDLVESVKKRLVHDKTWSQFFHDWAPSPWHGGDDTNGRWFPRE